MSSSIVCFVILIANLTELRLPYAGVRLDAVLMMWAQGALLAGTVPPFTVKVEENRPILRVSARKRANSERCRQTFLTRGL
jgi:hypothetical protein